MRHASTTLWFIAAVIWLLSSCTHPTKNNSPQRIANGEEFEYLMNHCEIELIEISSSEVVVLKMTDGSLQHMTKSLFNEMDGRKGYRQQRSGCTLTIIDDKQ